MTRDRARTAKLICALSAASVAACLSSCRAPSTGSDEGSSAALSTGNGLQGQYFSGMAFNTPVLTRTDPTVNFTWASSPGTGVPSDQFSVRWTGQVEALYSEVYTFYTQSDDGVRLWVNGQQLVNNWTDHASVENSGTIALTAGQRYALTMEFYDNASAAIAILSWSGVHTVKQVIPQTQLYVTVANAACGTAKEGAALAISCPTGQTIATIGFASYGTPTGSCGSFATGTCNAATCVSIVSKACLGKTSCSVTANNATFGDPCPYTAKQLFTQATCSIPGSSADAGTDSSPDAGSNSVDSQTATDTGASPIVGTGTGLRADYFNGMAFDTLVTTRTDPTVGFDWEASPATGVNPDQFSVRWTGQVQPLYSQTYTFYTLSDDGIRLWVNGQPLIDNWTDHASTEDSGTLALTAGQKYDLKLEFYDDASAAIASLSWSAPSQVKQVIPSTQLYPATAIPGAGGASGAGGTVAAGGTAGSGGATATAGTPGKTDAGSTAGTPGSGGSTATAGTPGSGGLTGAGATAGIAGGSGACTSSSTIQLIGNRILDTSGKQIVARGPEMVAASTDLTSGIDTAAAMGANAARLLLTVDAANGMTPATFDTIVGRAVSHDMLVWISLYTWDAANNNVVSSALGGGNFYSLPAPAGTGTCSKTTPSPCYLAVWSRQWLKDLIAKYKGHVIVDAMQEYIGVADASSEAGRTEWATAAQTNIKWFRSAGYVQPLEVMSNFQGRDLFAVVEQGASIRGADTLVIGGYPQTMFGWQAYWADSWYKSWQGGLLLGGTSTITGAQAVHQFAVTQQFPIEVGFDNYPGDTSTEYKAQIDQAAIDNASWLWWSWTGSNTVECPNDGATCQSYVTTAQAGFAGAVRSTCGM